MDNTYPPASIFRKVRPDKWWKLELTLALSSMGLIWLWDRWGQRIAKLIALLFVWLLTYLACKAI